MPRRLLIRNLQITTETPCSGGNSGGRERDITGGEYVAESGGDELIHLGGGVEVGGCGLDEAGCRREGVVEGL